MYFAILFGAGLGLTGVSPLTGVAIATISVVAKALLEIVVPPRITFSGASPYKLYVQNLRDSGDMPKHPWVSYLVQSVLFFAPAAWIAYFVIRYMYS